MADSDHSMQREVTSSSEYLTGSPSRDDPAPSRGPMPDRLSLIARIGMLDMGDE